jgi:hypothetical protein
VTVTVTVEGVLARVWSRILGAAATRTGIATDLDELVALITPASAARPATPTRTGTLRA